MSHMGGVAIVVFSDLVDSTQLLARLGDDRMEEVRRAHIGDVRGAVEAAGGRVIKTLGDGAMASFESALGALRAAAGIQAGVERLDAAHSGLGIVARVGVAAGEPIAHEDDLHGMAVVISSRLCAAAAAGDVLVHDLVAALVASRDGVALEQTRNYELKGVPLPVRASRLRWRDLVQVPVGAGSTLADSAELVRQDDARPPDGVPLPRMLAAYAQEPLIGRNEEIGALRECTAPRAGSRAVLVLGEPGIGKTRHAAAAATDAHAQGAVVVLARCPPEATIAFEPWVRAIGELARVGDEAWRSALAQAAGSELAVLVPELDGYVAASVRAGASEVVAAEGARYRLLHGIGAALAHAAGEAPLHVVLDDAHWCDAASAQALGHLLESSPTTQLVLVVTARERELGRKHPVTRVLADLRRTGDLSELRLEGLDDGGLAALVAARVGRAITPRLAARLRARTAGNPFFAAELARDLDERGALREGEALEAAPVPDAVTDLVEERLARLDPMTERLLVAVAAIGPSAPVALAARAAGIGEDEAAGAVGEAVSERLVDDVPAAQPTIAFPHALIREALTASTDDATRARLHLATALALEEQPDVEPAELARHYGLAVSVAGPERAIAAYKAAAAAAAQGHDHEQAAAQLRRALALIPQSDLSARAGLLLELGEQELLAADLLRAREAFRAAGDAARTVGDADTLARAALGFAGGDIAFGWETGTDDIAVVTLLREALDALGDSDPRLALRMILRLSYALTYSEDEQALSALAQRARELDARIGDTESQVLARFSEVITAATRSAEPLTSMGRFAEQGIELCRLAEGCGRDDLLFRVVEWSLVAHYLRGEIAQCDQGVEHAAQIASRLGSPRFTWEVDLNRAFRLLDRGDRAGGEELLRRAGRTVRRLRPDIHVALELTLLMFNQWLFDGETAALRPVYAAVEAAVPMGAISALATLAAAMDGDHDTAAQRMERQLADDLALIRRPDIHLPTSLCFLAIAATYSGDRVAGERLRELLEPLRPYLMTLGPAIHGGHVVEWHIGRLELLAERPEAAVEELRIAVARADVFGLAWLTGWTRVDLAVALHRRNGLGDREQALATLAEGEVLTEGYGMRGVQQRAALARAELEGSELPIAPSPTEHSRPLRALTARTGRRALAALVRGQDDEALERRFSEPRRQRALLRAMARGFQPAQAGGFRGVIAYELEPYAIEAPPEAPWRWAIEIDSVAARARLLEPAPLETAVTVHLGLADWVRVIAGVQSAVTAVTAGRGSVEGDVILAARLEAMFGAS
jgi:class 3 adenylate cyclase